MSLLLPTLALASRIASTRHGAIDDHDGYDWRRSTSENHRNPAAPLRHEFAASRARLDYSWHVHYSLRRQEQQDAIIRRMLRDGAVGGAEHATPAGRGVLQGLRQVLSRWQQQRRGAVGAPAQPWAIFTAGCMGAGKTHVMELLDENGLLPLSSFVRIDVDRIRAALPETRTYERLNAQTAGLLTQLEAGCIAEVATEEAFRRGFHVWVDSSLRDRLWWSRELRRLRRVYPAHRLGR